MSRYTFFSFRYKNDNWRAAIVRNSWVCQDCKAAGFFDSADWEKVKRKNDNEIKRWIDKQLEGTSVTVVLIGSDTYGKKWINYEIEASIAKGNALLGIYVHNVKDSNGETTTKGKNVFDQYSWTKLGEIKPTTFDWVNDDGYHNIGKWIENAAKIKGL